MSFKVIKNDLYYETSRKLNIRFQESWCKELLVLLQTGTEPVGPYLKQHVFPNLPGQAAKALKNDGLDRFILSLKAFGKEPQTFFNSFKAFGYRNAQDVPVPTRLEFLNGAIVNLSGTQGGGSDYYNVLLPDKRLGTIPFDRIILE